METAFAAADRFLLAEARLVERRMFASAFLGHPPDHVVDALRGYQNADGGFGHGLEPDKRCPESLPIDVETALRAMSLVGARDEVIIWRAAEYLAAAASRLDAGGAVSLAFPVIEGFPRAEHWTGWTYVPGLNPTAGLAGLLWQLEVDHPWREAATAYCWRTLESGELADEVHALLETLTFLERVPDTERAERHVGPVLEAMLENRAFHLDPSSEGYGLTPLHVAPRADSRWRRRFEDAVIDAHLDRLLADQQPDGGWPITWEPPSAAARLEWRGVVTLEALSILTSYGRVTAPRRP